MVLAHFTTSEGNFTARLYDAETPNTVANFVGLAEGTKEWTDPRSGKKVKSPYYDGTIFHRVIDQFMIQGGDPLGQGVGGPGYTFGDEFHPKLRHDRAGILSMANRGPNTNGGQFFVTLVPTPWLDDKHSVLVWSPKAWTWSRRSAARRPASPATGRSSRSRSSR